MGLQKELVEKISSVWFFIIALVEYKSLGKTVKTIRKLNQLKRDVSGHQKLNRLVKANGKYYWNMHIPGFPGKALKQHLLGELNRITPVYSMHPRLSILFLNITKKCQLSCKHCYAHDEINSPGLLSLERLTEIGDAFIKLGVGHIHLGGGEPMMRYKDMLTLLERFGKKSEVWMATNGFNITSHQARELKVAGLTGAAISVDHFDSSLHNAFRGNHESFRRAIEATTNCVNAGLVTCWSLCATREFTSKQNLSRYVELAKEMKVHWIQFFEVMPSGRLSGQDVRLTTDEKDILEDICLEVNTSSKYKGYPLIEYIGIYQKKLGCFGAANRYVYIDTEGNIQPCPFCRTTIKVPVDSKNLEECLNQVKIYGCQLQKLHTVSSQSIEFFPYHK